MRLIRTIVLASVSFLGFAAVVPLAQARMVCTEVVDDAPPPLPEYDQPAIPGPGYVWTPGYWSYADDSGYYWVPGAWAQPPRQGLLWTPGYWGWRDGAFAFIPGYWGARVGFYGGVNYGHGYGGAGYEGGYWQGDRFFYNRAANNFGNARLPDVYEKPIGIAHGPQVSYHGGPGGLAATPTPQDLAAARAEHTPPTAEQTNHVQMAGKNPALQFKQNNGHPSITATPRLSQFNGAGAGAAPGHPAAPTPNPGPAMRPEQPHAAGAPLAPAPHPAAQPHAAAPAPHPAAPAPHAMTPGMPHAPAAAPHVAPAPHAMVPGMPHAPAAAPHAAPAPHAMIPGAPHAPAAAPHGLPHPPHPGPAERRRPGEEQRP